jgi:hypothetical protein
MKKTISELIREELVRILWEADGPTDPTGDEDFDNGSEASKQAKELGLVHKAYGYYMDPKTGKLSHVPSKDIWSKLRKAKNRLDKNRLLKNHKPPKFRKP